MQVELYRILGEMAKNTPYRIKTVLRFKKKSNFSQEVVRMEIGRD